jgi:hypothetical protein
MRTAMFLAGLASIGILSIPLSMQAAGSAAQPTICSRSCWGARAPSCTITQMSSLNRAVVHHTAGDSDFNTNSIETSKANVRAIQNSHMDGNGWCDIGYHFLVDKLGNIFEGRSGSLTSRPKGAHDSTNTDSFGFNVMGNFSSGHQTPTSIQMSKLYDVVAWKMPNGWSPYGGSTYAGRSGVGYVCGHRDVYATECPGANVYSKIGANTNGGEMRNAVYARINPSSIPPYGPNPSISVTGSGQIYIFGVDNATGAIQWNPTDSTGWHTIGGSGFQTIKSIYNGSTNRITVFGISASGPLYSNTQTGVAGGWAGFVNLGGTIKAFDVILDNGNLPIAFGLTSDGQVWRNRQSSSGSWSGWISLSGSGFTQVKAFVHGDGTAAVFGCGQGTPLWQIKENTPGGSWGGWTNLGGTIDCIDVVKQSTGKPCVFCTATYDGSVWDALQRTDNTWAWSNLGGTGFGLVSGVIRPDGTMAVFGNGPGPVYYKVQTALGEAFPSNWTLLGGSLASLSTGLRSTGAMVLAGRNLTARTMSMDLQSGNNGSWGWQALGGSFK